MRLSTETVISILTIAEITHHGLPKAAALTAFNRITTTPRISPFLRNEVQNFALRSTKPDTETASTVRTTTSSSSPLTETPENPGILDIPKLPLKPNSQPPVLPQHWSIGPTYNEPTPRPLPPHLLTSLDTNTHPVETQDTLGDGIFITDDWRRAWYTYGSLPADFAGSVRESDGYIEYECDEIEGAVPEDLVGTLYRNGPGKFGVGGERVVHVLDADGMICQVNFPEGSDDGARRVLFKSRYIETKDFLEERASGEFLRRGTFGTQPRGPFSPPERKGLNADPTPDAPALSKVFANAMKTDIKNAANTHVISWGGKVLALFEAGLPYGIDPVSLETLGEDTLDGMLAEDGMPVKIDAIPDPLLPSPLGGTAHTAHPHRCPRTNTLVGWHWAQIPDSNALEVTITEWDTSFKPVASATHRIPNCVLAPHDMVITKNYVMFLINSFEMNMFSFLSGMKGPAASLKMDGRGATRAVLFPRPTSDMQFEQPIEIDVPAHFSIHFSHAYEDEITGNIISYFSGWPPSDATDFLGAWGGFVPTYDVIPPTYLWRLELDVTRRVSVDFGVAPGCANACSEFPAVHPDFATRKVRHVYAQLGNVVGDSSKPQGYGRLEVEDGSVETLRPGERNEELDRYFFGTRYSVGEPVVVPKRNKNGEREAYLLGMIFDAVRNTSFLAIFDLEKNLKEGPVCKVWFKSQIPHGLHGCFAIDNEGGESVFS